MNGSPFFYLLRRRLINSAKSLVRSPAKLIYALFLIAIFGFVIFSGNSASHGMGAGGLRDPGELFLIIMGFFTLIFLMTAYGGFNDGSSIFKLPDVTFLFAGPFTPRGVLFYGLFQQLATSVLLGFFIMFQYTFLHMNYGVEVWGLFVILIGYALMAFTGQLVSMIIYMATSGRERNRRIAQVIFFAVVGILLLRVLPIALAHRENLFSALPIIAQEPAARFFPVSGWLAGAVTGILTGNLAMALSGAIPAALGIAAAIVAIVFMNPDYYEDVIGSTEKTHLVREEAAAGRVREAGPKRVRVGASGLGGGSGASAFYYKHRLENRRARFLFFDRMSLIFTAVTIGFAYFMREAGSVAVLSMGAYMQMFGVALGRFVKELTKPYIYLVPETAMKKLLWSLLESLGGFVVDGILTSIPVGLILGLGAPEIAAFFFARVSFSILILAANLACERVFGSVTVKALIMLFYFFMILIMAVPGIVLAVVLAVSNVVLWSVNFTVLTALFAANLPVSLLVLFLCRDILSHAELKN